MTRVLVPNSASSYIYRYRIPASLESLSPSHILIKAYVIDFYSSCSLFANLHLLTLLFEVEMTESNGDEASSVLLESQSKKRRIPGACDICKRKKSTCFNVFTLVSN